jgi:hypothetical protein
MFQGNGQEKESLEKERRRVILKKGKLYPLFKPSFITFSCTSFFLRRVKK